jgi:hypothetical protein
LAPIVADALHLIASSHGDLIVGEGREHVPAEELD